MVELSAPRYIMPMIVSSCHHCEEQLFHTLTYVHYIYTQFCQLSKVRFIHTSTTTRSHSCFEKTTRTARVHLVESVYTVAAAKLVC